MPSGGGLPKMIHTHSVNGTSKYIHGHKLPVSLSSKARFNPSSPLPSLVKIIVLNPEVAHRSFLWVALPKLVKQSGIFGIGNHGDSQDTAGGAMYKNYKW